jgi:hypothetical protein
MAWSQRKWQICARSLPQLLGGMIGRVGGLVVRFKHRKRSEHHRQNMIWLVYVIRNIDKYIYKYNYTYIYNETYIIIMYYDYEYIYIFIWDLCDMVSTCQELLYIM